MVKLTVLIVASHFVSWVTRIEVFLFSEQLAPIDSGVCLCTINLGNRVAGGAENTLTCVAIVARQKPHYTPVPTAQVLKSPDLVLGDALWRAVRASLELGSHLILVVSHILAAFCRKYSIV